MSVLLDENGIAAALERIAGEISASIPATASVAVIGIRSRGDTLAARLIERLAAHGVSQVEFGTLDITLYRDDLAEIGPAAVVRTTEIPFDVAGKYLILVDDVIYSGRSIRAALDAIKDLGRPRAIRLAVLVDRGGRELPIQPDFVGVKTPGDDRHVTVLLRESGGVDRVEMDG
ncbi:MAG: bifunctional pyr operon transcriptional regulator/uracil phosphoribosyltransferase PyrR [Phycisphaerae bacterium]|nr:bifunctional pyr operon transcriptional regulator/uracil phosphoribosyltransferase PyrR [Phycisphaerae bacterium]